MDIPQLAERCEQAAGPDRELGREVLLACGWRKTERGYFLGPLYWWSPPGPGRGFDDDDFTKHDPTSSLDAAMTLVPERIGDGTTEVWKVERWASNGVYASHVRASAWVYGARRTFAATPALALCAAALRARASGEPA